ncbi:MAG: response regulator transcription factor [Actinomycetia bacterium]|nr:response regulator transcription factor [Actinomycetes bacterium]
MFVVPMDLNMPGIGGIEATRRLTPSESPPRVLVLTTYAYEPTVLGALAAGADGYLLRDAPRTEVWDSPAPAERPTSCASSPKASPIPPSAGSSTFLPEPSETMSAGSWPSCPPPTEHTPPPSPSPTTSSNDCLARGDDGVVEGLFGQPRWRV